MATQPNQPSEGDFTPGVGSETDITPLGRGGPRPSHERTADEEPDVVDWDRVASSDEFRALMSAKIRFIVPAFIFFVVYYFALPVLVGYFPELMEHRVIGEVNVAYLFALSQFFMAWGVAALYLRAASRFDERARRIISGLKNLPPSR